MAVTPVATSETQSRPHRKRTATTNVRSTEDWKHWLARFSVHVRKGLADTLDESLLRYARAESFELPPRR